MAIRPEDKTWIAEQMKDSVDALRLEQTPAEGFSRVLGRFRTWGAIAIIWTVPLALIGIIVTLALALGQKREASARFEEKTAGRLESIEKALIEIKGQLASSKVTALTSGPLTPEALRQVSNTVQQAREGHLYLDQGAIRSAAERLIASSSSVEPAWKTAAELLSYSTLDRQYQLPTSALTVVGGTHYMNPEGWGQLSSGPVIFGPDNRAEMRPIGAKDPNAFPHPGNQFLVIEGGRADLDTMVLTNVIIVGAHVVYEGGPLQMRNVRFVNCTFTIEHQPTGTAFASAVASSSNTNFQV